MSVTPFLPLPTAAASMSSAATVSMGRLPVHLVDRYCLRQALVINGIFVDRKTLQKFEIRNAAFRGEANNRKRLTTNSNLSQFRGLKF
jgi:hypothetical protein